LKPLPAWFQDLRQRMNFFNSWVENQRQPIIYWISAFSYPTAFLTAVLQRTARKDQVRVLYFSGDNFLIISNICYFIDWC
jgi:dynein heavy chain